ncbi:MAG: SpoIVB peptidase [Lachnospiraceae bacterium]|nr:SpoIVB peptidase [Lachnospiraceae bacterium]
MRRLKYKIVVRVLFYISLLGLAAGSYCYLKDQIPDHILVEEGETVPALFHFPFNSIIEETVEAGSSQQTNIPAENLHMTKSENGTYQIRCSLLGMIPLKTVELQASDREIVYPGGVPVCIYIETEGILVIGTGRVKGADGQNYEPAEHIIQSGDYITGVEGKKISKKEELVECIHASQGKEVGLEVERAGENITLYIKPVKTEDGEYKAGIWVRNDAQGVGTLTYEKENGTFGALGHGISDVDTSTLLELKEGKLFDADIVSVTKGEKGIPGELAGVIHYSNGSLLGSIQANTPTGIFGVMLKNGMNSKKPATLGGNAEQNSSADENGAYEIAYKQEVTEGPATLLCSLGSGVREYEIRIESVELNKKEVNKSMTIRVTDEELLEKTGGIVQGMSGSPILQNGRLVGAVTHVFVNDPTRGYGIFIENMLEQQK